MDLNCLNLVDGKADFEIDWILERLSLGSRSVYFYSFLAHTYPCNSHHFDLFYPLKARFYPQSPRKNHSNL